MQHFHKWGVEIIWSQAYDEIVILVPVSCSIFFRLRPSFPINLPTKLLCASIFSGISSVLDKTHLITVRRSATVTKCWDQNLNVYFDHMFWIFNVLLSCCTCSLSPTNFSQWQTVHHNMHNLPSILILTSKGHKLTTLSRRLPSAWSPWWSYRRSNSLLGWSGSWWASLLHLHFLSYGCRSCRVTAEARPVICKAPCNNGAVHNAHH